MILMNPFAGQNRATDIENTCGHSRGRRGWNKLRGSSTEI